jgi:hypothetical protein
LKLYLLRLNQINLKDTVKAKKGIGLSCGPFNVHIRSESVAVYEEVFSLYRNFPVCDEQSFFDFSVTISGSNSIWRKYISKQANFLVNSHQPFKPLPYKQAYPMLEWGMNWCIATRSHQYLIIHAAVINKGDVTVLMPAPPGSGKSTLTALLAYSGWRLLSDELALIRLDNLLVDGLARPINLKNQSIEVIKSAFPEVNHSSVVHDTHKGTVCLFEPPKQSVASVNEAVPITHVIFPKYSNNTRYIRLFV